MVLKISLHIYHDIPPRYSRDPHMYHDISHGTEHPHGTVHPHGTAHTLYRVVIVQLNWLSTSTRPDISFDVLELSMAIKHPLIEDLIRANK